MKFQKGIFITAWMCLLPLTILGEDAAKEESKIKTVKITLHPMAEPSPALKYKLLPAFIDLKPGNAAVFYNKLLAESLRLFLGENEMWDKAGAWSEAPLAELRDEKVRSIIRGWNGKVDEIKRASQCEYCDWQVPIREYGIATLLPDLQQTRSYARLLEPYARLQIAEGKYDDAVQTLQAGYTLGRHVANGPTLVHNLVGCTIVSMMSDQVRELIQQPNAPNLYWALTDLPRPIIDFRSGTDAEYDCLLINFPELRNLETKELAPDQWRVLLQQTIAKAGNYTNASANNKFMPIALSAFLLIEGYPRAKTFLIERGWPADKVEDMPLGQVLLIAGLRQYDEIKDDLFKWMYLPYPEAIAGMKKANAKLMELSRGGQEILPLASLFMPAMSSAKVAEARTERTIAILRVLEAIRLYGAAHGGQLPEKLSDITEAPIPIDPILGTAFIYHRIEDAAILEAPAPSGLNLDAYWLRYEIHLESKGK
ncbi:MAG: hypothetical protein ABSA26_03460 [Thermoguttaceae bacterium]|jgi:hypothetical protein